LIAKRHVNTERSICANGGGGKQDQAMVANNKAGLQRKMDALNKITEEYGIRITTSRKRK